MEKSLQELNTGKEHADEVLNAKLEKVVKDLESIQSNVKVSLVAAAEARAHQDTLIETLDSKHREEDELYTDIRKCDDKFTGSKVCKTFVH